MVKVYLVEDEIIIRQSIKNSIDWQIVADRCHGKGKRFHMNLSGLFYSKWPWRVMQTVVI